MEADIRALLWHDGLGGYSLTLSDVLEMDMDDLKGWVKERHERRAAAADSQAGRKRV